MRISSYLSKADKIIELAKGITVEITRHGSDYLIMNAKDNGDIVKTVRGDRSTIKESLDKWKLDPKSAISSGITKPSFSASKFDVRESSSMEVGEYIKVKNIRTTEKLYEYLLSMEGIEDYEINDCSIEQWYNISKALHQFTVKKGDSFVLENIYLNDSDITIEIA